MKHQKAHHQSANAVLVGMNANLVRQIVFVQWDLIALNNVLLL
jgi:hypothetical protein